MAGVQWVSTQVKGALEGDIPESDLLSCLQFNEDGSMLAVGDRGGRVMVFQRDADTTIGRRRSPQYNLYSTFQSHEPEFDYLKSQEIVEEIVQIQWLRRHSPAQYLLSTNEKTIKLWRISEKDKRAEGSNLVAGSQFIRDSSSESLRVPLLLPMETLVEVSPRRIFANAHTYNINSISLGSDQETFLSADDLRINLWHMDITDECFTIVDKKPSNMEDLSEVITASQFNPKECNLLIYSSSKGSLRLCDLRQSALCDDHCKIFNEPESFSNNKSCSRPERFLSEIISSTSDVKFSNCGRFMISRDFLTVKLWDLNMESKPIETFPVHDHLCSQLYPLYESDRIFDKFQCCWNGRDSSILTGSYNNNFRIFDTNSRKEVTLEASSKVAKPNTLLKPRKIWSGNKRNKDGASVQTNDFNKKILETGWHPQENIIAVAATNNLFIFQEHCEN